MTITHFNLFSLVRKIQHITEKDVKKQQNGDDGDFSGSGDICCPKECHCHQQLRWFEKSSKDVLKNLKVPFDQRKIQIVRLRRHSTTHLAQHHLSVLPEEQEEISGVWGSQWCSPSEMSSDKKRFLVPRQNVFWILTKEGSWSQLAFVHTVDRAVRTCGPSRSKALDHFTCLDQCFATHAGRKWTVSLDGRTQNKQLFKPRKDGLFVF